MTNEFQAPEGADERALFDAWQRKSERGSEWDAWQARAALAAQADDNEAMAECMRMFRRDMIEAGVIGKSVPPMMMTEAILGALQAPAVGAATDDWQHLKRFGYAPGGYMGRCCQCSTIAHDIDKRAITCRPCAETMHAAAAASEPAPSGAITVKVGDHVWFRAGRMHGNPPSQAQRAMVTKVRNGLNVDLEIGCEDMSEVWGKAGGVPHTSTLTESARAQVAYWWHAEAKPPVQQTGGAP